LLSETTPKSGWASIIRLSRPVLDLTNTYDRLFLILLVADVVLRVIWLDKPVGSLIFDEWYYVNVARVILGLPQSLGSNGLPPYQNATPGLDPNREHPPLAKLIIALSIYLLGDNGYGWRIASVVFGSLSVLVFYLLMKKIANYKMVPLIATFLFSFDNLIFVHSRIGILDIFTLMFMLLGFYTYFAGHNYLSALSMALSTLTKITGAAGLGVLVIYHAATFGMRRSKEESWSALFSWFEKYFLTYLAAFLVLLTILDWLWVGYSGPFAAVEHLNFILKYSTALTSSCPNGIISCPWQWLINQVSIPYLSVNVQVTSGNVVQSYTSIAFIGAMNPTILYLTIPAIAYAGLSYWRKRESLNLFVLVWFAVTYLPYYPAVIIGHRVTYLFYFLLTMPAVCAAVAQMIADQNPPKLVVIFYLAVVLVSFYMMFPFKVIP